MKKYIVCMDVGGTEIKAALLLQQDRPEIFGKIEYFPANAHGTKEEIIAHFCGIITKISEPVEGGAEIGGVRMAFPGPFDYKNGICLLKELAKYDSLYGVNLKQAIEAGIRNKNEIPVADDFDIRFVNDVGGFALGELYFGSATAAEKAIFVCIGTGCGSAFAMNGALVGEEAPGVPPNGYIYDLPFRESRIDDYISKRGLCGIAQSVFGEPLEGGELSKLALAGNENAILCFKLFGKALCEALLPVASNFKPDCLVLGGQVIKSALFFIATLEAALKQSGISLYLTADTSKSTLFGLLKI